MSWNFDWGFIQMPQKSDDTMIRKDGNSENVGSVSVSNGKHHFIAAVKKYARGEKEPEIQVDLYSSDEKRQQLRWIGYVCRKARQSKDRETVRTSAENITLDMLTTLGYNH